MTEEELKEHLDEIIAKANQGKLTVFLGAGANYAQCPDHRVFGENSNFLPTGGELAAYLAEKFRYTPPPGVGDALQLPCGDPPSNAAVVLKAKLRQLVFGDLNKVSEQVQINRESDLDEVLYDIFSKAYVPTSLHTALATLAARQLPAGAPVFITTNYDTMIEQALASRGVPFDVLFYQKPCAANQRQWFYHWRKAETFYAPRAPDQPAPNLGPKNPATPVSDFASYSDLPLDGDRRAIVVKMHGTVSPVGQEYSSFVITQDDYIQFLRLVPTASPLPTVLNDRLNQTHFLFLGYGLGDWNILAIFQNLWNQRQGRFKNWAVINHPSAADIHRWSHGDARITLLDLDANHYGLRLQHQLATP